MQPVATLQLLTGHVWSEIYLNRAPEVDSEFTRNDPFAVRLWPERLKDPLKWRRPRHIFVNSMSDLFHKDVPNAFIREIFQVMLQSPWHTYQILTKRPSRARRFFEHNQDLLSHAHLPNHIWIGTSVENQAATHRIKQLLQVPVEVRFISCEPLIGSVDFDPSGVDWVIVGGESGIVRRPMKPEWVRAIRDRCQVAGVPFFFKQWGGRTPKAGGRVLDGRQWNDMPHSATHLSIQEA